MEIKSPPIALENALDLRELCTTGSVLHLNLEYDDVDYTDESEVIENARNIGKPVENFSLIEKQMQFVEPNGFVKKKIIDKGSGLPLHKGCTVTIVFSGFWENEQEPFDMRTPHKPLTVDLNDNGLLPGLQIAVHSMLVGELSVFLFSYKVMYGEMGCPPKIKPKADCIFYIKLIKNILTPKEATINFAEPNTFKRVQHEVKMLYSSGYTLFQSNNFIAAIQLFKKAVNMLHRCRLANDEEQNEQEKLLKKLYINLAVCYNATKDPFKACIACNELNKLHSLWNNGKALFQNAKALTVIGDFAEAEKKFRRALKLCPNSEQVKAGLEMLEKRRIEYNRSKLLAEKLSKYSTRDTVSEEFKKEVNALVRNLKEHSDLRNLTLPEGLSSAEINYAKSVCEKENVFCFQFDDDIN